MDDIATLEQQLVDRNPQPADNDNVLRPRLMGEFVGQRKVVENLQLFIQAARSRNG